MDSLQAKVTALLLERDMRQMAEARNAKLLAELATSQAREQQLREALDVAGRNMDTRHEYDREREDLSCAVFSGGECDCHVGVVNEALRALALPHDTSALEAIVDRAGEVIRSQALLEFWCPFGAEVIGTDQVREKIRALPGVKLEDLK